MNETKVIRDIEELMNYIDKTIKCNNKSNNTYERYSKIWNYEDDVYSRVGGASCDCSDKDFYDYCEYIMNHQER